MQHNYNLSSAICFLAEEEKEGAIKEVVAKCTLFKTLPDIAKFEKAVLIRESIETTGIGHNVAIAHGKIRKLSHIRVGLGISKVGVEYNSMDSNKVNFLFVIASSPTRQVEYIKSLSLVLRLIKDPVVQRELLTMGENLSFQSILSDNTNTLIDTLLNQPYRWLWNKVS
ncbi:MAG: PTS sugar transporter subunit IIA [Sphaerochaetaceae bacterium]